MWDYSNNNNLSTNVAERLQAVNDYVAALPEEMENEEAMLGITLTLSMRAIAALDCILNMRNELQPPIPNRSHLLMLWLMAVVQEWTDDTQAYTSDGKPVPPGMHAVVVATALEDMANQSMDYLERVDTVESRQKLHMLRTYLELFNELVEEILPNDQEFLHTDGTLVDDGGLGLEELFTTLEEKIATV